MIIRTITFLLIISFTLISCKSPEYFDWRPIKDLAQENISLRIEGKSLKRINAENMRSKDAWSEEGHWKNNSPGDKIAAWVFVYSLIKQVYTNRSRSDLEKRVRDISGDGYVSFEEQDQFNTRLGLVEVQYYTTSGLNCFFVEYFWGGSHLNNYAGVRQQRVGEHIVGNNILQGFYCAEQSIELGFEDIKNFLVGIEVKGAYWPENSFEDIRS